MLKSFQKAMIIESAMGQAERNVQLQAKVLDYLRSPDITVQDMVDVADAIEDVFVPVECFSMHLAAMYPEGEIVTLSKIIEFSGLATSDKLVSNCQKASKIRKIFTDLGGLSFIA